MTEIRDMVQESCGTEDKLILKLKGGRVRRYHAEGALQDAGLNQTVDSHTWRVLIILLHLWPEISRIAILYTLAHDVAEGFVGDVPSPIKREPVFKKIYNDLEARYENYLGLVSLGMISTEEYMMIKVADYLELCLTCAPYMLSTAAAKRVYFKGKKYVMELLTKLYPSRNPTADLIVGLLNDLEAGIFDV